MKLSSIILFQICFFLLGLAIGDIQGRENLIKNLETTPSITTKTHYLMCISKPLADKSIPFNPKICKDLK